MLGLILYVEGVRIVRRSPVSSLFDQTAQLYVSSRFTRILLPQDDVLFLGVMQEKCQQHLDLTPHKLPIYMSKCGMIACRSTGRMLQGKATIKTLCRCVACKARTESA